MTDARIAGIILAGGESSRMGGRPKALIFHEERTFLEHAVQCLESGRISDIVVVTGPHHDQIAEAVQTVRLPVSLHHNPHAGDGQFSSLREGLQALPSGIDAAVVHLVDHPFVKHGTVVSLVEHFRLTRAELIIPSYRNRRGHPVLISSTLFEALLRSSPEDGMRGFLREHESAIVHVEVDDPGIRLDIDTPGDLRDAAANDL